MGPRGDRFGDLERMDALVRHEVHHRRFRGREHSGQHDAAVSGSLALAQARGRSRLSSARCFSLTFAARAGAFVGSTDFAQITADGKWIRGIGENSRFIARGSLGATTVSDLPSAQGRSARSWSTTSAPARAATSATSTLRTKRDRPPACATAKPRYGSVVCPELATSKSPVMNLMPYWRVQPFQIAESVAARPNVFDWLVSVFSSR